MSSHVHIGLYDALREAGASEESARIAAGDFPAGPHLASKEDLLQAIAGVNDRIGQVETEVANLRGDVKAEIGNFRSAMETRLQVEIANFRSAMETRLNDKFAPLDRGMAVLKYGYGPIIVGLLIKIAFF